MTMVFWGLSWGPPIVGNYCTKHSAISMVLFFTKTKSREHQKSYPKWGGGVLAILGSPYLWELPCVGSLAL